MHQKFSILFIEDEQNILDFVTKLLKNHGYKVSTRPELRESHDLLFHYGKCLGAFYRYR